MNGKSYKPRCITCLTKNDVSPVWDCWGNIHCYQCDSCAEAAYEVYQHMFHCG